MVQPPSLVAEKDADVVHIDEKYHSSLVGKNPTAQDAKPPSVPVRPTAQKPSNRPNCRRVRPEKVRKSQCPSFRMDVGDTHHSSQRESSLARSYEALDGDVCGREVETKTS